MAIPGAILDGWEEAGSTLRLVISHVGVNDEIVTQITEATGVDAEGPAVDLAYIRDDEWEDTIANIRINENPPNILNKSRNRQLLAAARTLVTRVKPEVTYAAIDGEAVDESGDQQGGAAGQVYGADDVRPMPVG